MRLVIILGLALTAAVAAARAAAARESIVAGEPRICGQIHNGPRSDWSLPPMLARRLGLPARFRGRTWTVLAKGTSCSFAMSSSRRVLRRWAQTKPGSRIIRDHGVRGYIRAKDAVPRGGRGSPGGQCLYLAIGRRFGFYQLGSLSLGQIERLVAAGRLPTG